jgi:hypothetical protein
MIFLFQSYGIVHVYFSRCLGHGEEINVQFKINGHVDLCGVSYGTKISTDLGTSTASPVGSRNTRLGQACFAADFLDAQNHGCISETQRIAVSRAALQLAVEPSSLVSQ